MNPRTLHSGWTVAVALLGAVLVGLSDADRSRAATAALGADPAARAPTADPLASSATPSAAARAAAVQGAERYARLAARRQADARADETFEHETHDGLFPLCTGCHLGAETGDAALLYPEPETCLNCHDGETEERIEWKGPAVLETNLDFDHGEHIRLNAEEGEDAIACAECHGDPGEKVLVEPRVKAAECLTCHGEPADDAGHYVEAACAECHVPAAASTLGPGRIAELPTPPDHEAGPGETFLASVHGERAEVEVEGRCATCHVQDQCADCHVNAGRVDEIRMLLGEPAGRPFPALEARYPTPESHGAPRFAWEHTAVPAADGANCATCHTTDACRSCHIEPVPGAVAALVDPDTLTAPGAALEAEAPESHQSAFFMERHGTVAAADEQSCATCHAQESFCASCHERQMEGGASYHQPNYLLGHAAEAANAVTECATCHDPVAFCRTCHQEAGLQSAGRLGPGYHDAEPLWLLRHPQAARQQLESCVTCHTQRDCLQCHSQLGAFQISPHGPDFDARTAYARNPQICRACHLGDPFGGGAP
jgi:hypothetical protein